MRLQAIARVVRATLGAAVLGGLALDAAADAVTDWTVRADQIVVESKLGPPPAIRVTAIVQTAVFEAVTAIAGRNPAAVDAAVAAANRGTLAKLIPSQQAAVEAAYQAALAAIPDGPGKTAGIAVGEEAAAAVLARRGNDGAVSVEAYRPYTTAGVYVPTPTPAVPQWAQRRPWLMTSAAQFRPGPPPALASEAWARDYNEVKALGGKSSARRSVEQTEIARFWEFSLPPIYHGVVRSVAGMPGRDVTQNARLFAAVTQAMDDALIAVFDAKYHYGFWRPATAIRNGDIDNHTATERDPVWTSLIEAPMHPEYPSAHSSLAAAVGTVLKAEIGAGPMPVLTTTSPTAKGAVRRWPSVEDFVQEVSAARIYAGIHYRTSVEVGEAMGKQIGALAISKFLQPVRGPSATQAPPPTPAL